MPGRLLVVRVVQGQHHVPDVGACAHGVHRPRGIGRQREGLQLVVREAVQVGVRVTVAPLREVEPKGAWAQDGSAAGCVGVGRSDEARVVHVGVRVASGHAAPDGGVEVGAVKSVSEDQALLLLLILWLLLGGAGAWG